MKILAQKGRSMVEMLGVLAIVGVLSVGAIAGYSKAMMKYKLNKHAEAFNILLNNALQYKDKWDKATDTTEKVHTEIFGKLGLIPDGMYVSADRIKDRFFNTSSYIYTHSSNNFQGMSINFGQNPDGMDYLCRNIITVAKENSAHLREITKRYTGENDADGNPTYSFNSLRGDDYCTENSVCLSQSTLTDIQNLCQGCGDKPCTFTILWPM